MWKCANRKRRVNQSSPNLRFSITSKNPLPTSAICHSKNLKIGDPQLASFVTFFCNPLLIIILQAPNCKIWFASISLSFPEFDIFFRSNLQISAGDSLEKFHIFQNCSIILFRHFKFIFFISFGNLHTRIERITVSLKIIQDPVF